MKHHITWGGEAAEHVTVRTSGRASLEGLTAFTEEVLSDSRWRPGMRVLVDHCELDWSAMTSGDLRLRVDSLIRERERLGEAHIAIVMARSVNYGIGRVMQTFADAGGARFDGEVFYTIGEARTWLSGTDVGGGN